MVFDKTTNKAKINESILAAPYIEAEEKCVTFTFPEYTDKDGDTCHPYAEYYDDKWHCGLQYEDETLEWDMSNEMKEKLKVSYPFVFPI